jgi:hypothetical protein
VEYLPGIRCGRLRMVVAWMQIKNVSSYLSRYVSIYLTGQIIIILYIFYNYYNITT